MELPGRTTQLTLQIVHEIVKRAPKNCPSKAAAVGASVLLVVASAVMARFAIANAAEAGHVREADLCNECSLRMRCKQSLVK